MDNIIDHSIHHVSPVHLVVLPVFHLMSPVNVFLVLVLIFFKEQNALQHVQAVNMDKTQIGLVKIVMICVMNA